VASSLRQTSVVRFSPSGLSDALDGTEAPPGACTSLQNLVPLVGSNNIWQCRPAAVPQSGFPGSIATPGFISVFGVFGTLIFGMISSSLNSGKDQPFAYNWSTNAMLTIGNILSTNVPTTVVPYVAGITPTVSDWVPPTIEEMSSRIYITHPGFSGSGTNFFGIIDYTNPAHIYWRTSNLASGGAILTSTITNGGTGYGSGTYNSVPLTGGTGTGATAYIVVAGGIVTFVGIDNPGSGYVAADSLSASNTHLGGSGSGFALEVTSVALGTIVPAYPPSWVKQFNSSLFFGYNPPNANYNPQPSVIFTQPLSIDTSGTNTNILTFGNDIPLVGAGQLGLSNQLGGIVQALMIFQQTTNIYQITGSAFTSPSSLAVNSLNVATGTWSPRSITSTPNGLAFLAPDGLRIINYDGQVSDPVGENGNGVVAPFYKENGLQYPSLSCAACNGATLRIGIFNFSPLGGTGLTEYWYHLTAKKWSGPHTSGALCIGIANSWFFISSPLANGEILFSPIQYIFNTNATYDGSNQYKEYGTLLTFNMVSVYLPDNGQMCESEIAEWQVKTSVSNFPNGATGSSTPTLEADVNDENTAFAETIIYTYPSNTLVLGLQAKRLSPAAPIVYDRLQISYVGNSSVSFLIGDTFLRVRNLGYLQQVP